MECARIENDKQIKSWNEIPESIAKRGDGRNIGGMALIPADHWGKDADKRKPALVSKGSGTLEEVDVAHDPVTQDIALSSAVWVVVAGINIWRVTYTVTDKTVEAMAAAKNAEAFNQFNGASYELIKGYPETEVKTWTKQETEARAWVNNIEAPVPFIANLAQARGVTMPFLTGKIIEKADLYAGFAGTLTGERQRVEDQVEAIMKDTETTEDQKRLAVKAVSL